MKLANASNASSRLGFDEVLLVSHTGVLDDLFSARVIGPRPELRRTPCQTE